MRRSIALTRTLVIAGGLIQLALGSLFWAGIANGLVPVHMTIGLLLVLSLWALAYFSARAGVGRGLVAFAGVWGLVLSALGFAQERLLPGSAHWIVQTVHLAVGLTALWLATVLASRANRALDAADGRLSTAGSRGAAAGSGPAS